MQIECTSICRGAGNNALDLKSVITQSQGKFLTLARTSRCSKLNIITIDPPELSRGIDLLGPRRGTRILKLN